MIVKQTRAANVSLPAFIIEENFLFCYTENENKTGI